jgi:hypothetical protein
MIEQGRSRANIGTVIKLANALGISREQLIYDEPPRPKARGPLDQ